MVGAQVVSVPMTVANAKAKRTLLTVLGLLLGGFALIAIVLNLVLPEELADEATEEVSGGMSGHGRRGATPAL